MSFSVWGDLGSVGDVMGHHGVYLGVVLGSSRAVLEVSWGELVLTWAPIFNFCGSSASSPQTSTSIPNYLDEH